MKVKIGNYIEWFGPYQLANALCFWAPKKKDEVGNEEFPEWVDKFGDWLSETWVYPFLQWVYDNKERKVKVKVDKWDLWSLDHTLALVILPVLIEYRKSKRYGVPVGLDIAYIPLEDAEEDKQMQEWNEILDKMIWSFEQIVNIDGAEDWFWIEKPNFDECEISADYLTAVKGKYDHEAFKKYNEKIQEGLELFGKYFRNLWD